MRDARPPGAPCLSAEDLEGMMMRGCAEPGCTHEAHGEPMWFHSRCHPRDGLWVAYDSENRSLVILCRAWIVEVKVDEKFERRIH